MSTVHDRYHVILVLDNGERDMRETSQFKQEAFDRAAREVARPGVASVEIFDSMARRGCAQVWRINRGGAPATYHALPPIVVRGSATKSR